MLPRCPNAKKVLVVEDDFILGEALSLILGADGFRVALAVNGKDALERLRGLELPQLILLDLMLPVMNGWDFRKAQRDDPRLAAIPTVLLSAVSDIDTHAIQMGATGFLQKPVETGLLLQTVHRCCV